MSSNPATLEVRSARPDDARALVGLLGDLGFPAPEDVIRARLEALLGAGEVALVAAREREVIGLVTLHVTPVLHRPTSVGRLTALVVAERARKEGVGRMLVAAAEKRLAARGCALVELTSHKRLTEAHAFYAHLGYEATSLRFKKSITPENGR